MRTKRSPAYQRNTTHNVQMRVWREALRYEGKCVNSPNHGPAWKGGRCEPCWIRKTDAAARKKAAALDEAGE